MSANYRQIELLSKEKISLARKVFAFVEAGLCKANKKLGSMENKMRKGGIEIFGSNTDLKISDDEAATVPSKINLKLFNLL